MIFNFGSINIDYFYSVPRLPEKGETLAAEEFAMGLGGKGANMSVAVARAGTQICHVGAVGEDGRWTKETLRKDGVDVEFVKVLDKPTGHAVINRDKDGENTIILFPGANEQQDEDVLAEALLQAKQGDFFLMQNETNLGTHAAHLARDYGLTVAYVAAPFDAEAVQTVLPYADILILNEVEMAQLQKANGQSASELSVDLVVVTKGSKGCSVFGKESGDFHLPAHPIEAVDTTGAGDTFAGYFLACLDRGFDPRKSAEIANMAAAIMATRKGTADAIPYASEVVGL